MKLNYIMIAICSLFFISSCKSKIQPNDKIDPIFKECAIPFTLEYNKILIKGNFKDSLYHFVLDNGCMVTCLSQTLFTRYYDTAELKIQNPEWIDPMCVTPICIKFKDYDFLVDTVIAFDMSIFDTKRENFSDKGGIIGVELFRKHIVELNFEDSLLTIKDELPEDINNYLSFDLLNIKNCTSKYDSLFKQIEVSGFYDHAGNSFTGKFILDLGDPRVRLHKTICEKTDFELSKKQATTMAAFVLSSGGVMSTAVSGSSAKEAQTEIIENGQVINVDDYTEQKFGDGFLGVSFFSKFHVIFDYSHNKLYLKRNKLKCE